ncbi:hypothetical protein CBER1_10409 [Cercospora berteroae]|uniref:Uncharacterized protein n=1 Tax=Cercospora berteroae TaxID=357750 RepID=A0A2S6BXE4_9PEZI|nr:hypothetical protein CBER1_10409 [Cercospora berteroae]
MSRNHYRDELSQAESSIDTLTASISLHDTRIEHRRSRRDRQRREHERDQELMQLLQEKAAIEDLLERACDRAARAMREIHAEEARERSGRRRSFDTTETTFVVNDNIFPTPRDFETGGNSYSYLRPIYEERRPAYEGPRPRYEERRPDYARDTLPTRSPYEEPAPRSHRSRHGDYAGPDDYPPFPPQNSRREEARSSSHRSRQQETTFHALKNIALALIVRVKKNSIRAITSRDLVPTAHATTTTVNLGLTTRAEKSRDPIARAKKTLDQTLLNKKTKNLEPQPTTKPHLHPTATTNPPHPPNPTPNNKPPPPEPPNSPPNTPHPSTSSTGTPPSQPSSPQTPSQNSPNSPTHLSRLAQPQTALPPSLSIVDPSKEKRRFHPDKFSAVQDSKKREEMQNAAREVFVVLGGMSK